jgi:two-component system sensor histidine kinase BarA
MKDAGIKRQLLVFTLIPGVIIALVLAGYFTYIRIRDLDRSLLERGQGIVHQIALASEYGVSYRNKDFLSALVNAIIQEGEVRAVAIADSRGRVLARGGPSFSEHDIPLTDAGDLGVPSPSGRAPDDLTVVRSRDELSVIIYAPIYQSEVIIDERDDFEGLESAPGERGPPKRIGWVGVELARTPTLLKQEQVLRNSMLITALVLLASALAGARAVRRVTDPISELTEAFGKLERGELDTRVRVSAAGELGTLQKGFNMMAATMRSARDDLQDQIDQATLELRETLDTVELQNVQLAIAKKEALAASKMKSEFLASVSHEIRTPLNGLLGYSNLLLKTPLDDAQRAHVSVIKSSGESLLHIVNDILDFSKIESGKLELESVDIDLRDCIEDVLDLMAPNAQEKGLELVYLVYSDVPQVVRGDPVRLRQVLINLVSNAVKFTSAGSVVVRLMREDESSGNIMLGFSVSDTGIGLSDQDQRRLFRAFSQADTPGTRSFGGTGLGLVISKKLVERMHGRISLHSEQGKGTTVTFTIRCEKSEQVATNQAPFLPLEGVSALLYEPHPIVRLALLENLGRWGVTVTDAGDPTRLGEILDREARFDIAVLGLPLDEKGLERAAALMERVRSRCECPVLALTNTTEQSRLNHLSALGVTATLSKPVRCARLEQQVEALAFGGPSPARAVEAHGQPAAGADPVDLAGVQVLVAEDNEVSRRLVAYLLDRRGAEVTVAINGRQALERIGSQHFDLVLMDVHMPEMDGATVTAMVRAAERGIRHTPVVALTADALEGNRERFLDAGMDDYLPKPVDEAALYAVVSRWVAGRVAGEGARLETRAAGAPARKDESAVLDRDQALKAAGGNEALADELLGMLVEEGTAQVQQMEQALSEGDTAALAELAHTMAGGAAHCGALALTAAAKQLEGAARDGDPRVASCLKRVLDEANRLQEQARGHLVAPRADGGKLLHTA